MASDKITQKDTIDKSVNKEIADLNKNLLQSIQLMTALTKASIDFKNATNPENLKALSTAQKEYNDIATKSIAENTKAATTLEKLQEKIKNVNEAEEKAKIALTEKKKAIKDKIKAEQDSKKSTESLVTVLKKEARTEKEAAAQNKKLITMRKQLDVTTKKGAKSIEMINKTVDKNNRLLQKNASALGKQKMNIGNYSSALSGLGGGFGNTIGMAQRFGSALKVLAANPLILILTGLVFALKGLVKLFKSTDDGATKLEATMNGLKAVLFVLKGAMLDLIEGTQAKFKKYIKQWEFLLAKITKNEEAANTLKNEIDELDKVIAKQEGFKDIADRAKGAYDAVYDLTYQMDALDDVMIGSISSQAQLDLTMEKLLNTSKDITKSNKERITALEGAQEAAKEMYGNEVKWANKTYDNEVEQAASKLKLTKDELIAFIKLDGEKAEEARKNNANIAEAWNNLKDEGIKALEDLYTEALKKDSEYYKKTGRIVSQLSGLKKSLAAQELKDKEILYAKLAALRGLDWEAQIVENDKKVKKQTDDFDVELEDWFKHQEALTDIEIKAENERTQKRLDAADLKKEDFDKWVNYSLDQSQRLTSGIINRISNQRDAQLAADVAKAKSRGASEAEIAKIEKAAAKERKKLAMTEAIIYTNLAAIKALFTADEWIEGIIAAATVIVEGAIYMAAIESASYAKGTKDSGDNWIDATVAEKGTERVNLADGSSFLTPNKQTKMLLPPHSEVIPNIELQRELAELQGSNNSQIQKQNDREDYKELIKVMKSKPDFTLNVTEGGFSLIAKKGNSFSRYLDRKYRGKV